MEHYKKERGVRKSTQWIYGTVRHPQREELEGLGQKPSPLQTKSSGPPNGDIWSDIFLAFNLALPSLSFDPPRIRYDDRVE